MKSSTSRCPAPRSKSLLVRILNFALPGRMGPGQTARVESRIDTENEIEYFRCGGILQYVLNNLVAEETGRRKRV
ncbi:MAG: hypothetical protein Ct9H300mP8_02150 [Gammaproteobacteria bacterium]|nr:MAG: hypothetical protein Ct9H300mP8_02150 [Gammaproteobacteria bacterium]